MSKPTNKSLKPQESQIRNPYSRAFFLKSLLAFATFGQALASSNQKNITALGNNSIKASSSLDPVSIKSFIDDFNLGKIHKYGIDDESSIPIQPNVDEILIKTPARDLQKELSSDILRFLAEYIQATLIETKYGSRPSISEITQPTPTDFQIAIESLTQIRH